MEPIQNKETAHLSEYTKVITKRKTLIVAFLAITVALTMSSTYMMKPIYRASSKLIIEKEQTSSPLTGEKIDYSTYQSQLLTFNTHFKLITSKPVIKSLIEELKLINQDDNTSDNTTNPIKKQIKKIKDNIKLLLGLELKQEVLSDEEKLERRITSVDNFISISQVRDTRLLSISVEHSIPERAAEIANTLAQKYIEFDMGSRLTSSKNNLEWMNNQIYELKKRLENDEKKFHEYKQMNKLFSIQGKQNVINQKIAEFNNEYLTARNKRLELDAKLEEVAKMTRGGGDITNMRSIINNPTVDAIYDNLTKLELESTRLNKVFKKKHPKITQNLSEIQKNRNKLKTELEKELGNLNTERAVLAAREKVMEKNISEFEADAVDASGKELRYTILQRNMTTSQNLYDTLVTKVKESGVMSNSAESNIRIVEMAAVPISPVSPNKKKNMLLSILLGLFGGVGISFFLEYLDRTIRTEEDVENYLKLPVLATIPLADVSDRKGAY